MPYENEIRIAGHLGSDAEFRQAGSKQIAEFSVAVSRGKDKETDWFRVVLWEPYENQKAALVKGAGVAVKGRMLCDKWEKDGQKRESWKLNANAYGLLLLAPKAGMPVNAPDSDVERLMDRLRYPEQPAKPEAPQGIESNADLPF